MTLTRDAIISAEHKVNGKSKGSVARSRSRSLVGSLIVSCVYLTCRSSDEAQKIGAWFRDK